MDSDQLKRRAAEAAIPEIRDGMRLGVGTGSTVDHFITELARAAPRLDAVVSSSNATTRKLEHAGIEVVALATAGALDLYVDGADEATRHRHLIKGGGGALTREKVLAGASRRFVCMIERRKLVGALGTFPLPVEVIPMARAYVSRELTALGATPRWRENFVTDNGNHIIDLHNLAIESPVATEERLNQVPGVVTVGLFARRPADLLLVAGEDGVERMD